MRPPWVLLIFAKKILRSLSSRKVDGKAICFGGVPAQILQLRELIAWIEHHCETRRYVFVGSEVIGFTSQALSGTRVDHQNACPHELTCVTGKFRHLAIAERTLMAGKVAQDDQHHRALGRHLG